MNENLKEINYKDLVKYLNFTLGLILIALNLFLLAIEIGFLTSNSPNFAIFLLPIMCVLHLFLIPAIFGLKKDYKNRVSILVLNLIGLICISFLLSLFDFGF